MTKRAWIRPARNQNIPTALVQGLYWAMIAAFFAFINAYLLEVGYTDVQIGWISTIMYLVSTVAGPLAGYITDVYVPARRYLCWVFVASVPFVLLVPAVHASFAALAACVVAVAILQNISCGVLDSWIMRIRSMKGKDISFPLTRCGGSILYSLTALTIGHLITSLGYPVMFVSSLILVAATVLAMQFLEPVGCPGRDESRGENIRFGEALRQLLHCREYVIFIAASVFFLYALRVVLVFLPNLYFAIGGDAADVGKANAISSSLEIPFILMMLKPEKFAKTKLCLASFLLGGCKTLTMLLFPTVGAYLAANVFQGISYGFQIAFSVFYIQKITPPKLYATATMIYTTANVGLGCMLGSLTGGYMLARSPQLLLAVSTACMVLSAAVFALTFIKPKKEA